MMCLNSTLFLFSGFFSAFSTRKVALGNGYLHSISNSYGVLALLCSCDKIQVLIYWNRWSHCVSKENWGGHSSFCVVWQRGHIPQVTMPLWSCSFTLYCKGEFCGTLTLYNQQASERRSFHWGTLYLGSCLTCPLTEASLWDIIH